MGLIDKLKDAGEQATASARESLQETQLRHDVTQAYAELGRASYQLLVEKTLADHRLQPHVDRIGELKRQLDALGPQPGSHDQGTVRP